MQNYTTKPMLGGTIGGVIGEKYGAKSLKDGPTSLGYWKHKGAHALLGCAIASAKAGDYGSEATGAVIGKGEIGIEYLSQGPR